MHMRKLPGQALYQFSAKALSEMPMGEPFNNLGGGKARMKEGN